MKGSIKNFEVLYHEQLRALRRTLKGSIKNSEGLYKEIWRAVKNN